MKKEKVLVQCVVNGEEVAEYVRISAGYAP